MADTVFSKVFPSLKAVDNGDGTYSLAVVISTIGGLSVSGSAATLADDAVYALPTGKAGFCLAMLGDDEYATIFSFTAAGVPTEIINGNGGANIRWTDVDTFFCVYDGGTGVVLKNRTGAPKTLRAYWVCS